MWLDQVQWRRISQLALAFVCLAHLADAAGLYDPALRFRQIETDHFVIYFHQGEESLARQLAPIAEEAWRSWETFTELRPPKRTHVVLADQSDISNGWATPLPYNTIVINAAAPAGFESIAYTTDWLRVAFTHEFAHIVHLGRSRSWAGLVRNIFGRVPLAFPNLFLPQWEIEGFATYFETDLNGGGRQYNKDFRAIERESARGGRSFPMDRANGGLIAWPGGNAPYAYGMGFQAFLVDTLGGQDRLIRVAEQSAGRVPYTASRVFEKVYDKPLGQLWKDYQLSVATPPRPKPADGQPLQLTHEGFVIAAPRFAPPACEGCPPEIVYSVQSPSEFPSLKAIPASGLPERFGEATVRTPRTLTTRYLGSTVGVTNDTIFFDQLDFRRSAGLYSDLYALDRRSGRVRRLTREARLLDPDVSPDGRMLVAVREGRGTRDLVTLALADDGQPGEIVTLVSEPGTQFSTPRWSPDGRTIAAERRRLDFASEIVVVDLVARTTRVIATGVMRAVTPTWRPDGRSIIAATDQSGDLLNLFEFVPESDRVLRRQLTFFEIGGATWPEVSADGTTLVFVTSTDKGFDLFAIPLVPLDDSSLELSQQGQSRSPRPVAPLSEALSAGYQPSRTLLPRAWMPLLAADGDQAQLGWSTGGTDVLGYHAYAASMLWRLTGPDAVGTPSSESPDWSVGYAYDRWQPRLFVNASRSTSFYTGASAVGERASTLDEHTVEAGVFLPLRRVRHSERVFLSGLRSASTVSRLAGDDDFTHVAARAGWSMTTAHSYGYSISPEDGLSLGVTAEAAGTEVGDLDRAPTVTADIRAYLPGLRRNQVVALRLGGGTSSGPRDLGRTFRLGGATPNPDVMDFDRGAFSLLRGFAPDTFAGRRIAVLNADYRLPLARIERGAGTWPIFVRTIHAAAFADVANAWTDSFDRRGIKTSFGAEASADIVLGYYLPLTVTAGVALGHDGAGIVGDRTTGYVRIGRAF